MINNIFAWSKAFFINVLWVISAIVTVLTAIDYFLKWKIYPYIFVVFKLTLNFVLENWFKLSTILYLGVLTFFLLKQRRMFKESKPNILETQINENKVDLETKIKKVESDLTQVIKSSEKRAIDKISTIEYTVIEYEIERHREKGQIGEISMMIKKLNMDKKRGWGVEDTLFEIREYIKNNGMPNYYFADINKALETIPDELKSLKEEILKLAQEKLYKVN